MFNVQEKNLGGHFRILYSTVGDANPFFGQRVIDSGSSTPLSELLNQKRSPSPIETMDELYKQLHSSQEKDQQRNQENITTSSKSNLPLDFDQTEGKNGNNVDNDDMTSQTSSTKSSLATMFIPKPYDPFDIGKATLEVRKLIKQQEEEEVKQKKIMESLLYENTKGGGYRGRNQRRKSQVDGVRKMSIMKGMEDPSQLQTGSSSNNLQHQQLDSPISKRSNIEEKPIEPSRSNPFLSDSLKDSFSHISSEKSFGFIHIFFDHLTIVPKLNWVDICEMVNENNINPNSLIPLSFSSSISSKKRSERPIPLFFTATKKMEDGCMSPPPTSPTPNDLRKNIPFIDNVIELEKDRSWLPISFHPICIINKTNFISLITI